MSVDATFPFAVRLPVRVVHRDRLAHDRRVALPQAGQRGRRRLVDREPRRAVVVQHRRHRVDRLVLLQHARATRRVLGRARAAGLAGRHHHAAHVLLGGDRVLVQRHLDLLAVDGDLAVRHSRNQARGVVDAVQVDDAAADEIPHVARGRLRLVLLVADGAGEMRAVDGAQAGLRRPGRAPGPGRCAPRRSGRFSRYSTLSENFAAFRDCPCSPPRQQRGGGDRARRLGRRSPAVRAAPGRAR